MPQLFGGGRPPRVVLFIGHHKTGSSALQDFLSRNALALLRAGILYPSVEAQGAALMLATALRGHDPLTPHPPNLREAHNALAFQMMAEVQGSTPPAHHPDLPPSAQMLQAIRQQIEVLQPRAVILCAEVFSNFAAAAPAMISRLRDFLEGCDVTLMATLRRPDAYLVSWESQRMKFGQAGQPLRNPARLTQLGSTIHLNYAMMLRAWTNSFPEARVVLRDYHAVLAAGGSIPDFCAHCGLDMPQNLPGVPDANPAIPVPLIEIMRHINRVFDAPRAEDLRAAVQDAARRISLPPNTDIECFGPDNRDRLQKLFAPSADFLAEFSGQSPFFAQSEAIGQLCPIPDLEAARAALSQIKPIMARRSLPQDMRDFIAGLKLV